MIHLDTSFLIRGLIRGSTQDKLLRRWLASGRPLAITTIVWAEFLCGPMNEVEAGLAARLLGDPTPFGTSEALTAAGLFNDSGRRRGSFIDCLIAAAAIESNAELATANQKDFRPLVPLGLKLATT